MHARLRARLLHTQILIDGATDDATVKLWCVPWIEMMDAWGRRAAIAVTPAEMEATVGMDGAVSHRGDCG